MDPVLTAIRNKNCKIILLPVDQAPIPREEVRMRRNRKRRTEAVRMADRQVAHAQPAKKQHSTSLLAEANEMLEQANRLWEQVQMDLKLAERQKKKDAMKTGLIQ